MTIGMIAEAIVLCLVHHTIVSDIPPFTEQREVEQQSMAQRGGVDEMGKNAVMVVVAQHELFIVRLTELRGISKSHAWDVERIFQLEVHHGDPA